MRSDYDTYFRSDYDTYFYFRVEYKVNFSGLETNINKVLKVYDFSLSNAFFKALAFSVPVHRITYLGCVFDDGLNYFEPSDLSDIKDLPISDESIESIE